MNERQLSDQIRRQWDWGEYYLEFPTGRSSRGGIRRIDALYPGSRLGIEFKGPGVSISAAKRQADQYAQDLFGQRGLGGVWRMTVTNGDRWATRTYNDGASTEKWLAIEPDQLQSMLSEHSWDKEPWDWMAEGPNFVWANGGRAAVCQYQFYRYVPAGDGKLATEITGRCEKICAFKELLSDNLNHTGVAPICANHYHPNHKAIDEPEPRVRSSRWSWLTKRGL